MAYLVDTDWVIQALTGNHITTRTLRLLAPQRIHVTWVTMAEVYEGAFSSSNPRAQLVDFRRFLSPFLLLTLSEPIAERFAEIRAFLRRRGQPISDFDVVIAATALHHDLTLLTFNRRHFERIPDLNLYDMR